MTFHYVAEPFYVTGSVYTAAGGKLFSFLMIQDTRDYDDSAEWAFHYFYLIVRN